MDGYRLPISLGVFNVDESNHQGHQLVDDLTIITGMLTHYQQKAGPDYRPNAQELSRMTYYASNRPGKIAKLASELEKRVRLDCRKAKTGNIRARSYVQSFET